MNFILILMPILFVFLVQTAYAQSPFDMINESVNDQIENTFDSATDMSNSTNNGQVGNGSEFTTMTPTTNTNSPADDNSTSTSTSTTTNTVN